MVKAFEPNAHCSRARADSDQANAFDNPVSGFGHDSESDGDVRALAGFRTRARLADGNGPFGEHSIHILGDPPSDVVDGSDARNNLATEQSQFLDCGGRVR
jgi:hypothetical protein